MHSQIDPHATSIIFESGCEIYLIPIDVTHTNLVTKQRLLEIEEKIGKTSDFSQTTFGLLDFFYHTYKDVFGFDDGRI